MFGNNSGSDSYGQTSRRPGFKWFPILIFAVFGIVYYFSNQETVPITGRSHLVTISRDEEVALGLQSYESVLNHERVISQGPEVDLVRGVGARIAKVADAPGFEWEFNLLSSDEENAFCLPGGKVAVYSGILPLTANPNGLAVVMGHEIAHAIARHGAERMAQEQLAQMGMLAVGVASSDMDQNQRRAILGAFGAGTQFGIMLPFSRTHESEADHIGLMLMARACFDPNEAPKFWERMAQEKHGRAPPQFMSTHPSDATRIDQIKRWLPEALAERQRVCGDKALN